MDYVRVHELETKLLPVTVPTMSRRLFYVNKSSVLAEVT